MFFLLYFRQRQRDAKAGAPLRAVGGGDFAALSPLYMLAFLVLLLLPTLLLSGLVKYY